MKKNIAIVMVATNYYFPLGLRFINRWSNLYQGSLSTIFHFYSETDPSEYIDSSISNVVFHKMTTKNWSEADVSRIYEILKLEKYNYDYIYIFDADTNINYKFDDYLLNNEITAYEHYLKLFEEDPKNACYFDVSNKDIYYQTCLLGGKAESIIRMCKTTLPWIEFDKKNKYIPKYIAEAYFNKYLHLNPPSYIIFNNKSHPFNMTDKGYKNKISGIESRPFANLSNTQYNRILYNIKNNKKYLWNIVNHKFIIENKKNIEMFKDYE